MRLSSKTITKHTDAGRRKNNEDYCDFLIASDREAAIIVLADGMGGHSSGEVASRCAVDTVLDAFRRHGFADPEGELREAILDAHDRIRRKASNDEMLEGMGTTLVACVITPSEVTVGHVGDSRGLQFRDNCVRRLTEDHLYVTDVLGLSENIAKQHANGNMLSQALGQDSPIRPSIHTFDIALMDTIVLCTDGITDTVTEPDMLQLLRRTEFTRVGEVLVKRAIRNGSADNCTVIAAIVRN